LLVTVNNRLKLEIEIVHDLSCHPIQLRTAVCIVSHATALHVVIYRPFFCSS